MDLTDEEMAAYQAKLAASREAAATESKGLAPWQWVVGAIIVALLTAGMWAAGRIDQDCQKVAGANGQTLNVCVDSNGNISDGDR